jgi:uncharacterized protein (TIGR02246 family)
MIPGIQKMHGKNAMGDHDADIHAVIAALADAWRRHDADAFGSLFTENATYTTFMGTCYRGRRAIADSHRALFDKPLKGTQLASEIDDVRVFGSATAIVTGRGDTYKHRPPASLSKVQTYTLVREADGRWRIAAFHNTQRKPLLEALTFRLAPGTRPQPA